MAKTVAGFMAVGLNSYWGQFEGMRARCEMHHQVLKKKFDTEKVDIVDVGIVDSEELARDAQKTFTEKKVEILFCQMLTYSASVYIAPAVRGLDVPVILLNVQYPRALDCDSVRGIGDWLGEGITCAGVPEATAVLNQLGKTYSVVTGHTDGDEEVGEEIRTWCDAAAIRSTLAHKNLGLFGRPFAGMMDLCVNESRIFEKFGTYVYHLDWQDIVNRAEKIPDGAVDARIGSMEQMFAIDGAVSREDIVYIARTAEALSEIAEEYHLHSFASHYEFDAPEEQVDLVAALNPALTMMMTEGISSAPEGDIRAALAMVILKGLSGNAMVAELYSMDFNDGTCLIGHSGACDANISKEKAVLKMSSVFHGKSGKGYMTQFFPEPGPVTMLALTETGGGKMKLVVAEGMGVEGPVLKLGDTNMRVKFRTGLKDFVNRWCMEGPTHHGVLAKGLYARQLQMAALVLGLDISVITTWEDA